MKVKEIKRQQRLSADEWSQAVDFASKEVGGTYATGYSVRNAVQRNTHVAKIRTSSGNEILHTPRCQYWWWRLG